MKKSYKMISILLAVIIVAVGSVLLLLDNKEREIVLTDFKYGEEYQYGTLNWGATLDEVEGFLNSSLDTDAGRTPAPEGYTFYNLADATYFLDGNETKTIVEFYEDGLSMIQFNISRPENPNELLEEIVTVWQESFGPETQFLENKKLGSVGYKWKTDNSMLTINCFDSSIIISVGTLEILNESDLAAEVPDSEETSNSETVNETGNVENSEGLVEFKLADLKIGGEYQIDLIPLGTSWYELRPWATLDGYQQITLDENTEYDVSDVRKYVYVSNESLLVGKRFNAIYEFLHDELVDVKLVFRNEENMADQFDPFVAELTKLFGTENDRTEDSDTGSIAYTWKTDNTRLQINLEVLDDTTKDMTLSIGYTEKELDRIAAENVKESRELPLAAFKQDQGYQFGEVAWKSSVEEVEALLNGKLKNVTQEAPKDYIFYDFKNVVYVQDGNEAKASFEFQSGELVYVDFGFYDLEDPKAFFEEIVSVFQDEYGTETDVNQNETTGNISYRWRTENSQLAIGFYEDYNEQVTIFLAPLK